MSGKTALRSKTVLGSKTVLRGITWDHPRGFDPMVATAKEFMAKNPGVEIIWEKRSLQAFADRPIGEMTKRFDLIVIDHPHVGEVAKSGALVALDDVGRDAELADLARETVGSSHVSYQVEGHQWALAIDAATPVAAFRADLIERAPSDWDGVMELAHKGQVACALIPINALMTFMGLVKNLGEPLAENPDRFVAANTGKRVLEALKSLVALMDKTCLELDPIGIFNWMGSQPDAPAYSPFGYGYTNYSRDGYCAYPLTFADAPGFKDNGPRGTVLGGTGIAVSSSTEHGDVAVDYAFWIAGAQCQSDLYFRSGGQPANKVAWESKSCNRACANFFINTRNTLDSAWVRPRYDGYMGFQERGGDIVHACLTGELTIGAALEALEDAHGESRS